jgi:2,4-dienoyl-CoA reductase-like NADH-dependent reductase (Old Yellow Enzyme family)
MNTLFSPLGIRNIELKNRIVVSPMQQYSCEDGFVTDWHLVHYGSRAVGGAGLIITESAVVHPQGASTKSDLGIWKDEHIPGLLRITDFVKKNGAKIAVQLGHFGSKGSKSHPNEGFAPIDISAGGWQTVSSSEKTPFPGMSKPARLTIEQIKTTQQDYVDAARRSVQSGFDAIEIHAAHGYLFHQFYSQLINDRTDNYGGSFENRVRFLTETVIRIRQIIPADMPLFVRISAVDYVDNDPNAWGIPDSIRLVNQLKLLGVDLVTASGGGFVWVDKSKIMEGYQVPFAQAIKDATGMLTASVGGIKSAAFANDLVATGKADLVVIAREHLRDPYFATHAAAALNQPLPIPWQYKRAYL